LAGNRETEILEVAGREVAISHPDKVLFPKPKYTKIDLVRYYLAVSEGALRGAGGRPNMLVRYPDGIGGEHFFQKRAPNSRPAWIEVVQLRFPSGRAADEVVPRDAAALAWLANLACLELHPHPVRAEDLEHPDELRIDLDPVPGIEWAQVQEVTSVARAVLHDFNLTGWPKTSGSRGMHICVRLERRWTFDEVRRAALALAREVEQRVPKLATSKWWKEERHGVFVDYNQNAKDRTVASAYSVRPTPDARVSAPLTWDEVGECEPADSRSRPCPRDTTGSESRMRRSTSTPARSMACSSFSSVRASATRPGRRITGKGHRSLRESSHPSANAPPAKNTRCSRSAAPAARRMHLPGSRAGNGATRKRRRTWSRLMCWSTRCVGATAPGRGIRVNLQHVPEELRPDQEPLDPDEKIRSSS
jgi:DNA ligase D-like protein (predicted polymerase)